MGYFLIQSIVSWVNKVILLGFTTCYCITVSSFLAIYDDGRDFKQLRKVDRHEDNAIQNYERPEWLEWEVDKMLVWGRNWFATNSTSGFWLIKVSYKLGGKFYSKVSSIFINLSSKVMIIFSVTYVSYTTYISNA